MPLTVADNYACSLWTTPKKYARGAVVARGRRPEGGGPAPGRAPRGRGLSHGRSAGPQRATARPPSARPSGRTSAMASHRGSSTPAPGTSHSTSAYPACVAVPAQLVGQALGGLGVQLHLDGDPLARGQHHTPVRPEAHPGGAVAAVRRQRARPRPDQLPLREEPGPGAGARRPDLRSPARLSPT